MNRGRPRHDDILTPREWQVLELIEAGLTNEEIAARLSISFGTAKYHVAEIISKLGVSSRDDAPAAARKRQTAASGVLSLAWMRGRFALPAIGVVVAAVLALAALALLTDVFRSGGALGPSEEDMARAAVDFQDADAAADSAGALGSTQALTSYYFEARIESDQDDVLDTLRAWYKAPDRWRFEFGDFSEGIASRGTIHVSDGETLVQYEAGTNTYSKQSVQDYLAGLPSELRDAPLFIPTSLFIGPLPAGSREAFFGNLVGEWDLVERKADRPIAGRASEHLSYDVPSSGVVSFWLDREYPFILRFESVNPASSESRLQVEIMELALNEVIDEARFRLDLPEGAVEVEPQEGFLGESTGSSTGGQFDPPEGFYTPAYIPFGYTVSGTQMGTSSIDNRRIATYNVHLRAGDGAGYLDVRQRYRAGGTDEALIDGTRVIVAGLETFRRTEGDAQVIEFWLADVIVTLRANQLDTSELERIANSMAR